MNDNSMQWIFGISIIGAIIIAIGFVTSRNLPETQKKIRIRKFAAVALALICLSFPFFEPIVISYSNARYLDETRIEKINSIEDINELNKRQTYLIADLAQDIKDLREDLYLANRFYGNATRILLLTVVALLLNFAFAKKEEKAE